MHPVKSGPRRWRFRPGLWPTLAALSFIVLTVFLGNWQSHRAAYKRALQERADTAEQRPPLRLGDTARIAADDLLYRRVVVEGIFDPAHAIFLDNRIYNGVAGYYVLMPLRIGQGTRLVLVNRGWLPVGRDRAILPHVPTARGSVRIEGLAVDPASRYFELGDAAPQGRVWQNLDFQRYRAQSGLNLAPILVQQTNDSGDGLIRDWPRPDTGVAMHVGYAIQWYGLAATLAVLWLGLNLKRMD